MKKIIFFNSHPIQYFAPLYKYLAQEKVNMEVWYGSNASVKGEMDKGFGVQVKWDIPVLEGYPHLFFRNWAFKPDVSDSFWGVVNWGLLGRIRKQPKSIFIVPGWHFFSYVLCMVCAKLFGHTVCIRGEMPWNQELLKSSFKNKLKLFFLRRILFSFVDHFLYIGIQNRKYYEALGVPSSRLTFTPYAVDNDRFQASWQQLRTSRHQLKEELGIPEGRRVILYSGKFIPKKRPLDLLDAFARLNENNAVLVMVGDGELRSQMENFINNLKLQEVYLTGFVNQKDIAKYYSIADVFVLCSDIGETWGLVVNEAMNFSLPVVVSDVTGCSPDLVAEGKNGYVFSCGNVEGLADTLDKLLRSDQLRYSMGNVSRQMIDEYSFAKILQGLRTLMP